jgi:glycosyltransferase involved in cell wall biosynthesis
MSIYVKEDPSNFNRAMESIWDEQTIRPDEIVLVEDGPLTPSLYEAVHKWKIKLFSVLKVVSLAENVGLGDALNAGLEVCRYELVARMDTDDIALPDRFEKQLKVFDDDAIDICSGFVGEFEKDEKSIVSYRKVPKSDEQIKKFAKKRNPLNHPAVIFRKSVVKKVGGYRKLLWFEDYYLWVRMIQNGAVFYNIQEPLVYMRAGYGQLQRRRGIVYAASEVTLQKKFLESGFIGYFEFLRNLSIRFIARIVPQKLIRQIYKHLRD